jgi:hypothetical protein
LTHVLLGVCKYETQYEKGKEGSALISVLIAVLFAALVYALCLALGLPSIVGLIAAILVLLGGIPTGGYGIGRR